MVLNLTLELSRIVSVNSEAMKVVQTSISLTKKQWSSLL